MFHRIHFKCSRKYNEQEPLEKICNSNLSKIFDEEKWSSAVKCLEAEQQRIQCNDSTRYRRIDGRCNSLAAGEETRGGAFTPYRRRLPARYGDGTSSPRGSSDGRLPPALRVSREVHRPLYREDGRFTVALAVWGQFLDHDITATAASRSRDDSPVRCCTWGSQPNHPECFPVREEDGTCMEFVRSAAAPTCCLAQREQLNQATAYVDGSTVYGSDETVAGSLRERRGGRLISLRTPDGRELLPESRDPTDGCNRADQVRTKSVNYDNILQTVS